MELRFRDEFKMNKFCLTFDDPDAFGSSQWRWPRPVFVVYRLVAASYVIGWNIYGYVTIPTFGHVTIVFYTNWSYLVLALHLTLALLVTLYHSAPRKSPPEARDGGEGGQTAQARPGSHVITICGGACADLPGSVLHYHLQECGQHTGTTLNAAGKRKQRLLTHNNNDYKPEDERASRCRAAGSGAGDVRRCNGAADVTSPSGGKQRSKSKVTKGQDLEITPEGHKPRGKRRCRSVGVNCGQPAGDQPERTPHTSAARSRDRGRNPRHQTEVSADHRQSGRCGKSFSRHHPGPARETPDAGEDSAEHPGGRGRKQRRRRQAKVCHRRGKTVAFKCRSSNSSLDKIRSRAARRLTPEVKRRGRRSLRGGGGTCIDDTPPPSGSRTARTAGIVVDGGSTWQPDVDRGDKERTCADGVTSYRRDAGIQRSRHRRAGSKERSQGLSRGRARRAGGRGGVEQAREGAGPDPSLPSGESENRRLPSKPKGKHTFILRRSGDGAARKLTVGGERAGNAAQLEPSSTADAASGPEVEARVTGSRTTRSVGTNTSGAQLPQRISVIVENPNQLPGALDVMTSASTARPSQHLPLYIKASWVVFNIAASSAPLVSSVYFFVLFPMLQRDQPSFRANILEINLHGINSLIVLLEVTLSAFPVRVLHCVYPMAYGLTYVIFSVAYWALDKENNVLYPVILDWNHPSVSVPVVVGLVGLATPVLQLVWYGVYRLRLCVYNRLYKPTSNITSSTTITTRGQHTAGTNRKETQV